MYSINEAFEHEGRSIKLITLKNGNNMEVKLLNYGAAIVELSVPDRNKVTENIVLTYQNIEDYIQNPPYFGVTVGRTSGRIAGGEFCLEGQLYKLNKNFGVNHCHGGPKGFSHQVWSYSIQETKAGTAVEFEYKSPHGEEGYPGELHAKVIYTLLEENTLIIEYSAETNKTTLCNLTNHTYFNLSGSCRRKVTEQYARIAADNYLELDNNLIPTGKLIDVKSTPMDFSQSKLIGKDIGAEYGQLKIASGYDHPWLLKGKAEQIELYDPVSGRKMSITTTYPCVVVYSFNHPNNECLKDHKTSQKHDGICFETQYEPNGINSEDLHKAILKPGEKYYEKTVFKFSVNT